MEDAAFTDQGRARFNGDIVLRTFSPVRIERLLLTRLFDLTTGRVLAGADDGSVMAQTGTRTPSLGRREAAR